MKGFMYATAIAALVSLSSCKQQTPVNELKDFVEEFAEKSDNYTDEQIEKANKKFENILKKIDTDKLSEEDLKEIGKLQGEYAATLFKHNSKSIEKQMKKAGAVLDGFFKGVKDDDKDK